MNELASNHAEVGGRTSGRIGDWTDHLKEAVLLEGKNGGKGNEQDRERKAKCRG